MNALVAQWRPQRHMLFPVSSWKKSDFRQHRSHCEWETLKVVSSSQSSNLEKSNFNFMQLSPRSKRDLPRPQHLWNSIISFGGQTSVTTIWSAPSWHTRKLARQMISWGVSLGNYLSHPGWEKTIILAWESGNWPWELALPLYSHFLSGIPFLLFSSQTLSLPWGTH